MIEYTIVYKCRRCGAVHGSRITGDENIAMMAVVSVECPKAWKNEWGYRPTMTNPHYCDDGGFGVSDFIGVNVEEK